MRLGAQAMGWVVGLSLTMLAIGAAHGQKVAVKTTKPPRGAIVLFGGKDLSEWVRRGSDRPAGWSVADGAVTVVPGAGDIVTKREFGDFHLHLEFMTPSMPQASGQGKGNSGVYLHGRYEIQVLDSYNNETYKAGGCGAIYGQKDPDVNAALPPEQWQSYDITFRAPRLDADGKVVERPRVTVWWNGIKVHNDVEIALDSTVAGIGGAVPARGPILLQDHGNPVRYRNIWVKPLDPPAQR